MERDLFGGLLVSQLFFYWLEFLGVPEVNRLCLGIILLLCKLPAGKLMNS